MELILFNFSIYLDGRGLANLALLDEDARLKIHSAGGTKTLFEWYTDMDHMVQLETLAAMANLTLSSEVKEKQE